MQKAFDNLVTLEILAPASVAAGFTLIRSGARIVRSLAATSALNHIEGFDARLIAQVDFHQLTQLCGLLAVKGGRFQSWRMCTKQCA